ncbi:MAG: tRNA 2-thiouridine(34) synthase MnmA [Rickettsiales bacterium]|nr:tRNA 2-thiouridine(34) synthase MnmA [Rickettsiales bacterium]
MNSLGLDKAPGDTRVVVAMSGGVDSSVVAAMLHEQGYEVIGITLQLYDYGATVGKKGACCAGQDIHDARRVAETLGIPHYVLNYESKFKESVVEDFVETYLAGETPIPCVRCNQSVKFKDLLKTARELGADVMATGHYVQRVDANGKGELRCGADPDKDQSYFLFATTQEQLDFLRFPLGGLHKDETRKLAEKFGLAVADKPDSQDICFVPEGNYAKVIEKIRPDAMQPGDIMHIDGRVLAQHKGIINYTVGQRRGLGFGIGEPLYVLKLDAEKKRVIVGPREALGHTQFSIRELNWLDGERTAYEDVQVKVRSSQNPLPADVSISGDGADITLLQVYEGIAPGQACVVYDGDRVLGGGWITGRHLQQTAA